MSTFKLKPIIIITILSILFIFSSNEIYSQSTNLFTNPDLIKKVLDGKSYEVPGYGIITFEYSNSETRKMKEVRMKDGADDEVTDLIFDVNIKRNKAKRKDKVGYKIEMQIDSHDYDNEEKDPTKLYSHSFYLMRNIIYPIKDFPASYILFADGDLYYNQTKFKNISLNEYKNLVISTNSNTMANFWNIKESVSTSKYIRCIPLK